MKSAIKRITQGLLLVPLLLLGLSVVAPIAAAENVTCPGSTTTAPTFAQCGTNSAQGTNTPSSLFGDGTNQGLFKTIVNIMLFIVGAVAVIMLIIGGVRYVVSGGDQNAVTGAKNTILYAIIGIVVAVLAFAVVNFVVTGLAPTTT